jgi:deoxyxylulose-5-phosphate synthase
MLLKKGLPMKVQLCGINDNFVTHGDRTRLLKECNLTVEYIVNKIVKDIE